jgi:hypothetical protein
VTPGRGGAGRLKPRQPDPVLDIDVASLTAVKALQAWKVALRVKAAQVERPGAEAAALRERQAATDARPAELEALVGRMPQQR